MYFRGGGKTRKKGKVLTKRERRKAGEDMETESCKRRQHKIFSRRKG